MIIYVSLLQGRKRERNIDFVVFFRNLSRLGEPDVIGSSWAVDLLNSAYVARLAAESFLGMESLSLWNF